MLFRQGEGWWTSPGDTAPARTWRDSRRDYNKIVPTHTTGRYQPHCEPHPRLRRLEDRARWRPFFLSPGPVPLRQKVSQGLPRASNNRLFRSAKGNNGRYPCPDESERREERGRPELFAAVSTGAPRSWKGLGLRAGSSGWRRNSPASARFAQMEEGAPGAGGGGGDRAFFQP